MQITQTHQTLPTPDSTLRQKAREMETAFLAEMLRHSGLNAQAGQFGGGIGEEQFASFMREAQAKAIVEAGGIGLSEPILRALSGGQT